MGTLFPGVGSIKVKLKGPIIYFVRAVENLFFIPLLLLCLYSAYLQFAFLGAS